MKSHRETMRFIANLLDQMQDRRMMIENDRFALAAVNVNDLLPFGDAGERRRQNAERVQGLGGGVQLPYPSVDQDQVGQWLALGGQAAVAALHGLAHRGEIVVTIHSADDEFPVFRFPHPVFGPNHHGRDGVRALHVRHVKALDAPRRGVQAKSEFERLDNRLGIRPQHAETLFERVARVSFHEFQELVFGSPLRDVDFHSPARPFKSVRRPHPMQPTFAHSDKHIAGGTRQKWGEHRGGESILAGAEPADVLRQVRESVA